MKKALFALIAFPLFFTPLKAQHLTNRQVYDFNVGDIFEAKSQVDNNPPMYWLTIVLKKWVSITSDTIYYVDSNASYAVHPFSFGAWRDTTMITNLDSLAIPNPVTSCDSTALIDTVYNDSTQFCGRRVWLRKTPSEFDTAFLMQCGETSYAAYVVEGCGGSYWGWFDPGGPSGFAYDLIFYKKGTDS